MSEGAGSRDLSAADASGSSHRMSVAHRVSIAIGPRISRRHDHAALRREAEQRLRVNTASKVSREEGDVGEAAKEDRRTHISFRF